MEKKVYSVDGKELRTINLDDKVFGLPVNEDVIYYAITNELANSRRYCLHKDSFRGSW